MSTEPATELAAQERPAVLDDRALFGHPRGLGLLFLVEMWERFSYYGMRAILVLFLVNAVGWNKGSATSLYGTYTSLVYLTPLAGGFIADRWLGTRRALVLGGVVIALGHFSLAFESMATFYAGLVLIMIGTGFFKPNSAAMVGQMYRPGDPRRDSGFTIYYMGVNAGAALGPLACGLLAEKVGWHYGFAAAGVGMVLGLACYFWGRERYMPGIGVKPDASAKAAARTHGEGGAHLERRLGLDALIGAGVGVAFAALVLGAAPLALVMAAAVGASLGVTFLGTRGDERKRVLAIVIVAFFVMFFWAAYEQAGSSMNLFADKYTDLHILGWSMPASWFQSLNPVLILVLAPVFAGLWGFLGRRGMEPSTALKMVFGLALLGVGFLFLVAGGKRADGGVLVSPLWLTGAYFFHTLGELALSPVGLSYVSKMAPARFAALLMGVYYLANAAGNKLAGALAGLTPLPGEAAPAEVGVGIAGFLQRVSGTNSGFYSIFVVSSFIAAAVMLLFVPLLKRLAASAKA